MSDLISLRVSNPEISTEKLVKNYNFLTVRKEILLKIKTEGDYMNISDWNFLECRFKELMTMFPENEFPEYWV